MKREWLQYSILRAAAALAPCDQRGDWLEEWRSELWYVPPSDATRFCLGAFRDAIWLRRNSVSPMKRPRMHLESPLSCLAFLAAVGAVGMLIAVYLSGPLKQISMYSDLRARDLPADCMAMLTFSCLLLPGTLAVWRAPANRLPTPWRSKLRRGIFLALKIALVQPIMLCGLMIWILAAPVGIFAPLGMGATLIAALRWVITDQQRRCPVCLRLLTHPVRIGAPSTTFLEWYGAEPTCSRGHGLMLVSEISCSYSRKAQWLGLGKSWSGLFSARQS
jgi:hypothetical protein